MGLFNKINEANMKQKAAERQRLMQLSEKELMVEIVLSLEDISRKSDRIQRNQVIWSD